ncbi:MAG: protein translocase subunit SecF [Peptococcaceae bacterium]|nr:protein translocase subunit SecF [Peptococcaceae bacterium]
MKDIIGKRKIWYILSLVIIIPGLISLMFQGLNLGIDFAGGSVMQLKFAQQVDIADLREGLTEFDLGGSKIQVMDNDSYQVKTIELSQEKQDEVINALTEKFGEVEILRNESVGPTIGKELRTAGLISLTLAILVIVLYISYRFELHFAIAAILSLVHDVFIVVAIFSILQLEVDSTFIAAVLTILGYSINDKIVVFDRIRENLSTVKKEDLAPLVNNSIIQSLTRSLNTSISTLILLVALFFLGGETTKLFVLAMIIGIVAGTYSSLCIASPIWYEIKMRSKAKRIEALR